jgi:large subunit ribosomal protein L2
LPGNYVLLKFLDKFCIFSNIQKNGFFKIALSSGTFSQLIDFFKDFNLVKISLPSKKCIFVSGSCFVLLGKNSQQQRKFCFLGKAGLNKNVGIKPKVRGVARNPVDHPHGGRTKTNKPEVSIWG